MTAKPSGTGSPSTRPGAATRHDAARPTREQVVAAVMTVLDYIAAAQADEVYDQWHLPAGCRSSDFYKRRHRQLRAADVEGVRVMGKTLTCTAQAWAVDLEKKPRVKTLALVPVVDDRESAIDEALGITTRSR